MTNIRLTYDQHTTNIRLTHGYIRIHTSIRRSGLSDTNVFLIKKALIIGHTSIFHTNKLLPGSLRGGGGRFDQPPKVYDQVSRSKNKFTRRRKPLACSTRWKKSIPLRHFFSYLLNTKLQNQHIFICTLLSFLAWFCTDFLPFLITNLSWNMEFKRTDPMTSYHVSTIQKLLSCRASERFSTPCEFILLRINWTKTFWSSLNLPHPRNELGTSLLV